MRCIVKITEESKQWRFYIGARGLSPPNHEKRRIKPPKFPGWYIFFFDGVATLIELTGSPVHGPDVLHPRSAICRCLVRLYSLSRRRASQRKDLHSALNH